MEKRPYKESRHKLTIEKGIICNGDIIKPPQSLRKEVLNGIPLNVHCGIKATQRRLTLQAQWPRYYREVEDYVKRCPKCAEIFFKNSAKQNSHVAQRKRTMRSGTHGSCPCLRHGAIFNYNAFIFRMA